MLLQHPVPRITETQDEFDLQDFFHAILSRWRTIIVITAITTFIALHAVLFATPQFSATGTVYLGDGQDTVNTNSQGDFMSDYQVISTVNTQIQLLQSPALLEQAILETGLNAEIKPLNEKLPVFWKWRFLYGKSTAIYAPGPGTLVAQFASFSDQSSTGAGFLVEIGKNGHYQLLIPGSMFAKPRDFGEGVLGQLFTADGIAFILKSADDVPPPVEGSTYTLDIVPAKTMAASISGRLGIVATGPAVSPTNVAQVQFIWYNPYQARDFVSKLMQDFIQSQLAWKMQSASNTETYISQQLEKISAALAAANQNQASYQSQTGIMDVQGNAQAMINQLTAYQSQRSTLLLQQEALQELVKDVSGQKSVNPYLISQANDPVLTSLATMLANAQVKLQSDESQFTSASPQIKQERATISRIESSISTLLDNDKEAASKNLANIDQVISQYKASLKNMPSDSLQVSQLSRSTDVLGTLYGLLMQKEEEAEVSKAATIEDTRIVSPAEVPLYASSPRPSVTVFAGIILGLIAGFGTVLTQRALSGKFRSETELRGAVSLPIYGNIPGCKQAPVKAGAFTQPATSPFMESFRMLRLKLTELPVEHNSRIILVSSTAERDGKTTIAISIAKILADDGKSVLLIDADMHCGNAHEVLGVPAGPGLAEWLATGHQPPIPNVEELGIKMLRCGECHGNPCELLQANRLADIFVYLRNDYDFIVLDSPPLPLVSDGLILSKFADIMLSVVTVEQTSRKAFAMYCDTINHVDCFRGIIVNGVKSGPYSTSYGEDGRARRSRIGIGTRLIGTLRGLRPGGRLRLGKST